ncbi:MAG TPA: DNA polymerase III subunit gamma/tau [Chloroflexia bacterium]|nr:DNA polymerase III subunit gamma/tau [Chloroflexia bacterium]
MTASTSLYRKYRSPSFDELVGQEPVVRTLQNAINSGRISHAYLFTGPRGVGKTSAARLLARAANCLTESGQKPCNQCPNCMAANRDIATDLIEIDAASNTGVDNIREVIERANFAPSVWHTKFYIIDEVHMLSVSAFNALLKTLEEPPPHTSFILATTEVHKVPATVASRCQRFDFRRIPLSAMLARLQYVCEQEGIEAETAALELVARQATGSLRDALSLMDQLRVYCEGAITLRAVQDLLGASGSEEVAGFVDVLISADLATGLRQINRILDEGLDLRQFNRQLVEHLRGLMLVKSGAASAQGEGSLLDATEDMRSRMTGQAASVEMADLLRWVQIFAAADASIRSSSYRQLPLEMALVEATLRPDLEPAPRTVQDRSADLAAAIDQVAVVPPQRQVQKPIAPSTPREPEQAPSTLPPPIHADLGKASAAQASGVQPADAAATSARKSDDLVEEPPIMPEDEPPLADIEGDQLARLRALWPKLVDHLKARSPAIAAVFRDPGLTRPHSVVGSVCTISFRDPIHVTRSRMERQRDVIEQALAWVLGYPCRLESITFAEAAGGAAEPGGGPNGNHPHAQNGNGAKPKPSPYDTTLGRAAMNIFGIEKFDDVSDLPPKEN